MNTANSTPDLNEILRPLIARIITLEDTVRKLLAQFDKPETRQWNEVARTATSRITEPKKKPAMTIRPTLSSAMTACLIKTSAPAKVSNLESMTISTCEVKNTKLPYAPARSMERQARIARGECFGCGQKGHTQKDCSTHAFDKIRLLLKPRVTVTRTISNNEPATRLAKSVPRTINEPPTRPTKPAPRNVLKLTLPKPAIQPEAHVPSPRKSKNKMS